MKRLFMYDFFLEEESGTNIYTDLQPEIEGEPSLRTVNRKAIAKSFNAFLDGTMRLYRIGYADKTGTPLYVAPISVALMIRDETGKLYKSNYSVSFTLVLFPFELYRNFIQKHFNEDISTSLADFKVNLRNGLKSVGLELIDSVDLEGERNYENRRKVFSSRHFWIISDTSRVGILERGQATIQENDLFNVQRVKEIAKTRARYFMGLAEFYSAFRYLKDVPEAHIMIDGAFYPYRRVGRFFVIDKSDYIKAMSKAVGFIKHPQKVPSQGLFSFLKNQASEQVLVWTGSYSEEAGLQEQGESPKEFFEYALIRFRSFGTFSSPTSLVKLQFSNISIEEVVNMVWHERNPVPTDRRRIYTESYPIQIAENVAKAMLPSEEMIRGFVLSLVPPLPVY